jgi:formylglycine-generating enzyme required for sulfatase activity
LTILLFLTMGMPTGTPNDDGSAAAIVRQDSSRAPEINDMIYIPAGNFWMGSTNEDLHHSAEVDEFPQHQVWVDAFYIDIHEVTNIQYKVFVDSMHIEPPIHWQNGNYPVGRDGYPVSGITWYDAMRYAEFVGKRLPTEAEWEKAARGTDVRRYPWGDEFDNTKANNSDRPMAVMKFPQGRSPYGLYDMAGNVAEWVDAWFAPYPRQAADLLDAELSKYEPDYGTKEYRVYRGGSWNNFGKYLRCANREKARPDERWSQIGFRCAMDPPDRE